VSGMSARLRASRRLRLAVLGAATLLVVGATSVIGAVVIGQDGPFTGCLSSKIGVIYNVAPGATPKAACFKGDTLATFSNAQGPAGPAGAAGAPGKDGVTALVSELPAGGQYCPDGGYAITYPWGTMYACRDALLMTHTHTATVIPVDGHVAATAPCPAGTKVTGGGYNSEGGIGDHTSALSVYGSWPGSETDLDTWTVVAGNVSTKPVTLNVFAYCAFLTKH
jgi:hypothetical protein